MKFWILLAALLVAASITTYLYVGMPNTAGEQGAQGGERVTQEGKDIYLDLVLEEVTFRKSGSTGLIYIKFYGGEEQPEPILSSHRLYHDAVSYGDRISREQYVKGKPALMDNK